MSTLTASAVTDDVPTKVVAAVVAKGLTKVFGEGAARMTAVDNVNFVANFGEMIFVVGPSGSGKTTFLSMISGILRPDAGSVEVKNVDIWKLSKDQLAEFRLNTIGFVFQDFHLFPRLTSAENVAIPLILKQRDWDEALLAASKCLQIVGLQQRSDILPVKLSGGEQQRVAIARALAMQPSLILFDEPTRGIDVGAKRDIYLLLNELTQSGKGLVVVSSDLRELMLICDRIAVLSAGKLVDIFKRDAWTQGQLLAAAFSDYQQTETVTDTPADTRETTS